ncbi:Formin homology 2 domain-containing protein [Spironucleus salmonicida]|uniref:Formin homology 2 domain-containing protein n=1 Tax=Spironucleus salmonicida TaxID=348837 RepID=A0A9P8LUM9_9EUKA|nr:Formin homology 2 domain-containing protein [Spironucleus salmonicida]
MLTEEELDKELTTNIDYLSFSITTINVESRQRANQFFKDVLSLVQTDFQHAKLFKNLQKSLQKTEKITQASQIKDTAEESSNSDVFSSDDDNIDEDDEFAVEGVQLQSQTMCVLQQLQNYSSKSKQAAGQAELLKNLIQQKNERIQQLQMELDLSQAQYSSLEAEKLGYILDMSIHEDKVCQLQVKVQELQEEIKNKKLKIDLSVNASSSIPGGMPPPPPPGGMPPPPPPGGMPPPPPPGGMPPPPPPGGMPPPPPPGGMLPPPPPGGMPPPPPPGGMPPPPPPGGMPPPPPPGGMPPPPPPGGMPPPPPPGGMPPPPPPGGMLPPPPPGGMLPPPPPGGMLPPPPPGGMPPPPPPGGMLPPPPPGGMPPPPPPGGMPPPPPPGGMLPPPPPGGMPPPPPPGGMPPPPPPGGMPPPPPPGGMLPPPPPGGMLPPPPPGGMPPPPPPGGMPPPPGTFLGGQQAPSQQQQYQQPQQVTFNSPIIKLQLKSFFWDKLKPMDIKPNSIWKELGLKDITLDAQLIDEVCQYFENKQQQTVQQVVASPIKPKLISILDDKLSNKIEIILQKFKLNPNQVRDQILTMQVPSDQVSLILSTIPAPEVIEQVLNALNDEPDLDKYAIGERYMAVLGVIPRLRARMLNLELSMEFEVDLNTSIQAYQRLVSFFQFFKKNASFKNYLLTMRTLGNLINYSNASRGGAAGFRIKSLVKFYELKGQDKTLLHWVNSVQEPEFYKELKELCSAIAKDDISELKKEFENILRNFNQICESQAVIPSPLQGDRYAGFAAAFDRKYSQVVSDAKTGWDQLDLLIREAQAGFQDIGKVEDFCKSIIQFVDVIGKTVKK